MIHGFATKPEGIFHDAKPNHAIRGGWCLMAPYIAREEPAFIGPRSLAGIRNNNRASSPLRSKIWRNSDNPRNRNPIRFMNSDDLIYFMTNPYITQGPFQEPKLEVPTIYKAYFSGLNFREHPHNSYGQTYGTNVPPSIGSCNSHWAWLDDPAEIASQVAARRHRDALHHLRHGAHIPTTGPQSIGKSRNGV